MMLRWIWITRRVRLNSLRVRLNSPRAMGRFQTNQDAVPPRFLCWNGFRLVNLQRQELSGWSDWLLHSGMISSIYQSYRVESLIKASFSCLGVLKYVGDL